MIPKTNKKQSKEKKIGKLDFTKILDFHVSTYTMWKGGKTIHKVVENITNHIFDKGLVYKIQKEHIQV
jgi:hypothetical protein